ncbi:hypothetical protein Syun_001112 [Stephania yunnanensis]|uniref:Uncharacterized protein n=1 Tax=Stephania yunnanensis TaxID=152371 RepID=A0AAP0LD41_9MAGN
MNSNFDSNEKAGEMLIDMGQKLPIKLDSCLMKVEQSPSESMRNAMEPSLKAFASENIREHSDVDVKVAAASYPANELFDTFTARQMGKVFFTNSGSEANDSQVRSLWQWDFHFFSELLL